MPTRPPGPYERAIVRKVQSLRQAAGWSQAEVAERLTEQGWDCYPQTIQKIEAGNRHLQLDELECLAAIFWITLPQLLSDLDTHNVATALGEMEQRIRRRIAAEILGAGAAPSGGATESAA